MPPLGRVYRRARRFVEEVYWPDLLAIASFYKDWAAIGGGVQNYMSVGEYPENGQWRDTLLMERRSNVVGS